MLGNFTGPAAFVGMVILMLLVVPLKPMKRFLWMGVIGGFGLALVLLSIMQSLLGFWMFLDVDLVYINNIPVTLSAVWLPMVIIFSYFVSAGINNTARTAAIIAVFALIPVIAHWLLLTQGLLLYSNWSLLYTFMLALAIHIMLYAYLHLASQVRALR